MTARNWPAGMIPCREWGHHLRNVWFHYPNTDRYVLQDINATIKQGEKVAIVGENGGQEHFVALLCGLYQRSGKDRFAGKELSEVLGLMRHATSFVFQDFGRYSSQSPTTSASAALTGS